MYISVFTHVMHLLDENQPIWNLDLTYVEHEMKRPVCPCIRWKKQKRTQSCLTYCDLCANTKLRPTNARTRKRLLDAGAPTNRNYVPRERRRRERKNLRFMGHFWTKMSQNIPRHEWVSNSHVRKILSIHKRIHKKIHWSLKSISESVAKSKFPNP